MKTRLITSIIILLIFAIASGCDLATEDRSTEVAIPSATRTKISPATSVFTVTPTILPTMTLVPALSEPDAEARVLELLSDNGGCQLPCFWGFTPGRASMQEYISFKNAYSQIWPSSGPIGGPGAVVSLNADTVMMIMPNFIRYREPGDVDVVRRVEVDMWAVHEGAEYWDLIFDDSHFAEYARYYSLPSLLSEYGPPGRAFIHIEHDMGFHDFYLYLDYAEQGWMVQYRMPLEGNDTNFNGCPDQSLIGLWLWAPEDVESATLYGYFLPEINIFTPLEEATSLTLDEFYQQFKDPANTQCLESPMELWMP